MRIVRLSRNTKVNKWLMTVRPDGSTEVTVPLEKPYCDNYLSLHFTNAYHNWESSAGDLRKLARIVRLDYEWRQRPDGRVQVRGINWPKEKQSSGGLSWTEYAGALAQVPLVIPGAIYAAVSRRKDLQTAFS
jgi:hypothetical protein